jgi:hypothetical protein
MRLPSTPFVIDARSHFAHRHLPPGSRVFHSDLLHLGVGRVTACDGLERWVSFDLPDDDLRIPAWLPHDGKKHGTAEFLLRKFSVKVLQSAK